MRPAKQTPQLGRNRVSRTLSLDVVNLFILKRMPSRTPRATSDGDAKYKSGRPRGVEISGTIGNCTGTVTGEEVRELLRRKQGNVGRKFQQQILPW